MAGMRDWWSSARREAERRVSKRRKGAAGSSSFGWAGSPSAQGQGGGWRYRARYRCLWVACSARVQSGLATEGHEGHRARGEGPWLGGASPRGA